MNDVSKQQLGSAEQIGRELKLAFDAMSSPDNAGQDILELAPVAFKNRLATHNLDNLRLDIAQQLEQQKADGQLLGGTFACTACSTLVYAGIVVLLGASVILSGGMSIPAVLAASGYSISGLAVVISALTGVTTGAVTALLTVAGTTLGVLVIGLCEAMGKC